MNFVNIFLKRLEETSTFERGDILLHGQVTAEWFGYKFERYWMDVPQTSIFLPSGTVHKLYYLYIVSDIINCLCQTEMSKVSHSF